MYKPQLKDIGTLTLILISLLELAFANAAFSSPNQEFNLADIEKACLKLNDSKTCSCLKKEVHVFLEQEEPDQQYLEAQWIERYYDNKLSEDEIYEDPYGLGGSMGVLASFAKKCTGKYSIPAD